MGRRWRTALRNGGCRLRSGGQPQADFHECPAETGTEVPGASGRCGETVRVGLRGPLDLSADVTTAAVTAMGLRPGDRVWMSVKATEIEVSAG